MEHTSSLNKKYISDTEIFLLKMYNHFNLGNVSSQTIDTHTLSHHIM